MSHSAFAVADTCFLIDWARYRHRDILFQVFRTVFVPEDVLNEIRSENTVTWVADALAHDKLSLYTPLADEVEEARRLVEESRLNSRMPAVDLPEALCLAIGRRRAILFSRRIGGPSWLRELFPNTRRCRFGERLKYWLKPSAEDSLSQTAVILGGVLGNIVRIRCIYSPRSI